MRRLLSILSALMLVMAVAWGVVAEEQAAEGEEAMPPMGPPDEIKEASWLIGDWNVTGQWRMDATTDDWTDFTATVSYAYILDGGAIEMDYKSEFMGMPMNGYGLQTYDRETGMWQATWIDNMMCRISYMEGNHTEEGELVFEGVDYWNGLEYINRMVISNETDSSYNWRMESSFDGGETFAVTGKAKYIKAK